MSIYNNFSLSLLFETFHNERAGLFRPCSVTVQSPTPISQWQEGHHVDNTTWIPAHMSDAHTARPGSVALYY